MFIYFLFIKRATKFKAHNVIIRTNYTIKTYKKRNNEKINFFDEIKKNV